MIGEKLKGFIISKGKKMQDFMELFDMSSKQTLSRKFKKDNFTIQDIIKFSDSLGCDLAIIDRSTGEKMITFTPEDIKKPEK